MKKAHVVFNNRLEKASKIRKLLLDNLPNNLKILSIGVGSGLIESFLNDLGYDITGVDVVDNRLDNNFNFFLVEDEHLPFEDGMFDVVISNHVIEHVDNQYLHLSEVYRVLRNPGFVYLATPNKYSIIEPHYRVLFLSWLPSYFANLIVSMLGRNSHFDINPLNLTSIKKLSNSTGFKHFDVTHQALMHYLSHELKMSFPATLFSGFYFIIKPIIPTFVFILKKSQNL